MAGLKNADDFAKGEKFNADALKFLLLMVGCGAAVLFFIIAFVQSGDKVILPDAPDGLAGEELKVWKDAAKEHAPHYSARGAMAYSWLFAVIFFMSLTIGGIFWTLLHNATNSGWGTVVRRLFENLGSVFIYMFLLSIPLVFWGDFRDNLWEWIPDRKEIVDHAEETADKEWEARKLEIEGAQATAKQTFAEFKAKQEAAMPGASDGDKHFLTRQIAAEEEKLNLLLAEDVSKGAIRSEIIKEYFLDHHHGNVLLWNKSAYLNKSFWLIRFFAYGIGLGGVIFFLRYWSLKQDETGDPKLFRRMRRAACGFLPIFASAWTFLVIDWLMALDYTWFSTMWGVYLFAGAAQSSMAFLIILLTLLRRQGHLTKVVTMEHYHLMGKLLLAFTIFWAYIAFSQFFLIWYANITEETRFYLTRNTDYWNAFTIAFLVIGHFILPFAALLIQGFKKNPLVISCIAGWILLMHVLDIYFIIIPERGPSLTHGGAMGIPGSIFCDILAWIAVGGLFGFFLLTRLGSASLFPCKDPRLDESLNVTN